MEVFIVEDSACAFSAACFVALMNLSSDVAANSIPLLINHIASILPAIASACSAALPALAENVCALIASL